MKRHVKTLLTALMALVLSVGLLTACVKKPTAVKPAVPAMIVSSKTVALGSTDDVKFDVSWNNGTLQEIKKDGIVLTDANYQTDDTSITILGSYVKELEEGDNEFTLTTDGGSCTFHIVVTDSRPANPTIYPTSGSFNIMDPADTLEFTVDWGKGSFTKLEADGKSLVKDEQYVIEGSKLTIVGKGMLDSWEVGDYTFTVTTTTGSADFTVSIVKSGSRYTDSKVFKVSEGQDVAFGMLLGDTTISAVKLNGAEDAIAADGYEYSDAQESFILKANFLNTLPAGIHSFRIELSNQIVYNVSVAVKTLLAENFENGNTNGDQITFGNGNSNISGEEAIDGKSVKMELEAPNLAGTFLEGRNIAFQANHLYILNMTVRIDGKTQLIVTVPGTAGNLGWMLEDGTLSTPSDQTKDSRSSITAIGENLVQMRIYLPVTGVQDDMQFRIFFRNGDLDRPAPQPGTQLVIDNLYIEESSETFEPASAASIEPDFKLIAAAQDVSFNINNNYGAFVSVTKDGEALTLGDDYSLDNGVLTVKAAYLTREGLTAGQTLELFYNTKNPDNESQTFASKFSIKMTSTVWGETLEQSFDGTNDVSFGVTMNGATVASVKNGTAALTSADYSVSADKLTVKASYLKTLTEKKPYQFVMTDSEGEEFRFVIYVGCTPDSALYVSFEDGTLPSGDNFGIVMSREINRSSFDGSAATLSGTGTMLLVNRPGFTGLNMPVTAGETYELSFQFKFAEGSVPGAGGDWGIFGNNNIFMAFGNGTFGPGSEMGKYAYIEADDAGNLTLVKMHCVENKTSLTRSADGVYTVMITFVAENNNGSGADQIQVPVWRPCTFDVDNIMVRNVPGVPTLSGSYVYDKNVSEDVVIDVNLHGSTVSAVRIEGTALAASDYSFNADNTKLTIKREKLATYAVDSVLKLTIAANSGISAEVTITISDNAPYLTGDDILVYQPEKTTGGIGLELKGNTIKTILCGDQTVSADCYAYDADTKTLTFTESYLKTLTGVNVYTIEFNETVVTIEFTVESRILERVVSMDFEDDNTIAPLETQLGTQLDGLASLTQEIVTVNGSKALRIHEVPTGLVTIYSTIAKVNMDPTYLYMYGLTITVKQGVPVLFRYVDGAYARDFFWILADGTLRSEGLNPRFSFTKVDNGDGTVTYDVLAFATPSRANVAGNGNFEIATFADAKIGAFDVTLDNLIIAKTGYPILQLDFETENEKLHFGQGIGLGAGSMEYVSGDSSLSGQNSLHYTGGGNLLLVRPNNQYVGLTLVGGQKYKLSFKIKIDTVPEGMLLPIRSSNNDIGYIRPDPNAPNEPYFEAPTGTGYLTSKTVLDSENNVYELSIIWTNPETLTEFDFALWTAIDMIVDDITIEVVR